MSSRNRTPILVGGDLELGNFINGETDPETRSDREASRRLLGHIEGFPRRSAEELLADTSPSDHPSPVVDLSLGSSYASTSQDFGRQYLASNGGCAYIDLNHLELATPETLSARDHQAAWRAMLLIARQAQVAANRELAPHRRVVVLANNSDRQGRSYGGHQSFLISRGAFDRILKRRLFPDAFVLMSYQASSLIFTGQGKVGSENGRDFVPFQISQRADFLETLLGEQTTYCRPLVNTRDEPLAGPRGRAPGSRLPGDRYARLHVIFYDTTLAPVATFLKVGVLQLVLAMLEADVLGEDLILEDPLWATHVFSRDPELDTSMRLRGGRSLTAIELQLEFLRRADAFRTDGGFEGVVADADEILRLWEDTLTRLETRDAGLRARLDWVMKRELLETTLANNSRLNWKSPELGYLDLIFSSIDPADSLFLALESAGMVETVATEQEIAARVIGAPDDTRAFGRAALLRAAAADPNVEVTHVDWDELRLRARHGNAEQIAIELADPLGATRARVSRALATSENFPMLIRKLQRERVVKVRRLPAVPSMNALSVVDGFNYRYLN